MTNSNQTSAVDPGRRTRRTVWTVLALALVGAVAAVVVVLLTSSPAPTDPADAPAVFVTQPDFQPGATPPCLVHQTADPDTAYEGGDDSQSLPQLTFLAYYTAAGREPFCDGRPATDTDRTWARLYVQLTTDGDNVSTILG